LKKKIKKKICFFVSDLNAGGTETSTKILVEGINKDVFHVSVVATGKGDIALNIAQNSDEFVVLGTGAFPKVRKLSGGKVKEDPAEWFKLVWWLIKSIHKFKIWIQREKIDLVHTNSIHYNFISGVACKLAGISSIWHIRTPQTRSWRRGGPFLVEGFLAACLASRFIANSYFTKNTFHKSWIKKTSVIWNAIDVDFIQNNLKKGQLRQIAHVPDKNKLVGVIGIISKRKGLDRFIQLAGQVSEKNENVNFVIIGGAHNDIDIRVRDDLIKRTKQLGIENKVYFTGDLADAACYACDIDVFFMCSSPGTETFGLVVIEAMAAGTPVVAFGNDAMPEIIEQDKTGFMVQDGDIDSAVRQVCKLLDDEGLSGNFAANSINRVKRCFDRSCLINSIEKMYGCIIDKKEGEHI